LNNFGYSTALAAQTLWDSSRRLVYPGLRLGITGLSRSGKTVFTTALIHNLMHHGDLPAFHATAKNTIRRVRLAPQPHVTIPRFPFEDHLNTLCRTRMWPPSTNRISEIRLEIEYENASGWSLNPGYLAVDIVDYPGEWLLDLTLLEKDYRAWSFDVMEAARLPARQRLAAPWLKAVAAVLPRDPADEARAAELCELFKQYLMRLRDGPESVATTPPGRFLMPGDLAGSPALTFFPMDLNSDEPVAESSFAALMQKRFDAYKDHVVKPFFRDHFQRVDRQIVLVDVLAALDGGPTALAELEAALDNVLLAFRIGRRSLFSTLFSPRADKVLFAATKADHLHHESHNRLNAVLRLLVHRAIRRGEASGAGIGTLALASVRATSEKIVTDGGEVLKAVAGVPEAGEQVGDRLFDGETEAVIFPGDLPERPETVFSGAVPPGSLRFPRFRPPAMPPDLPVNAWVPPNIRLDRALEFLIGDYLA
jgi:predicted YcjX-like family ATPase